jgi:uncharacterized protein (DUF2147 family)
MRTITKPRPRWTTRLSAAAAALYCVPLITAVSAAPPEIGLWYDDSGKGAVQIAPCGGKLCGHIVWLQDPLSSNGKPLRDKYNPEPGMRNRLICGIQVLGNLAPQSDGKWGQGWVYDPKVGKSYNVEISLSNQNTLTVYGYAGIKLFGKTLYWKRAPGDLPRCKRDARASQ